MIVKRTLCRKNVENIEQQSGSKSRVRSLWNWPMTRPGPNCWPVTRFQLCYKVYQTAPISQFPRPSSDTAISCKTTLQMRGQCITWCACLPISSHWYQIILLGDRGNGVTETYLRIYTVALWLWAEFVSMPMQVQHLTVVIAPSHFNSSFHANFMLISSVLSHILSLAIMNKYSYTAVIWQKRIETNQT